MFFFVFAWDISKKYLMNCWSADWQRFKPSTLIEVAGRKESSQLLPEQTKYKFDCINLRIAFAGSEQRVGTTTTVMNLVCWINAQGETAYYIETYSNYHCDGFWSAWRTHSGEFFHSKNSTFMWFCNALWFGTIIELLNGVKNFNYSRLNCLFRMI